MNNEQNNNTMQDEFDPLSQYKEPVQHITFQSGEEVKFDENRKLIWSKSRDGDIKEYGSNGNLIYFKTHLGYEEFYHETDGYLIHKKFKDGMELKYDSNGVCYWKKYPTGDEYAYSKGKLIYHKYNKMEIFYDEDVSISRRIFPDGTEIHYHKNGMASHKIKPDKTEIKFDEQGITTYKKLSNGEEHFFENGNLSFKKFPNGENHYFDLITGKVYLKEYSTGRKEYYNEDGQLIYVKHPNGTKYYYDNKGRLIHEIYANGEEAKTNYEDNTTWIKYKDGSEAKLCIKTDKVLWKKAIDGTETSFDDNGKPIEPEKKERNPNPKISEFYTRTNDRCFIIYKHVNNVDVLYDQLTKTFVRLSSIKDYIEMGDIDNLSFYDSQKFVFLNKADAEKVIDELSRIKSKPIRIDKSWVYSDGSEKSYDKNGKLVRIKLSKKSGGRVYELYDDNFIYENNVPIINCSESSMDQLNMMYNLSNILEKFWIV
jgi:YD repeat-containing protein